MLGRDRLGDTVIAETKTVSEALISRINECSDLVISLTISTIVPSFMASANSSTGPPALKNFPEPVKTTALHVGSPISDINLFLMGVEIFWIEGVSQASSDMWTTAALNHHVFRR